MYTVLGDIFIVEVNFSCHGKYTQQNFHMGNICVLMKHWYLEIWLISKWCWSRKKRANCVL